MSRVRNISDVSRAQIYSISHFDSRWTVEAYLSNAWISSLKACTTSLDFLYTPGNPSCFHSSTKWLPKIFTPFVFDLGTGMRSPFAIIPSISRFRDFLNLLLCVDFFLILVGLTSINYPTSASDKIFVPLRRTVTPWYSFGRSGAVVASVGIVGVCKKRFTTVVRKGVGPVCFSAFQFSSLKSTNA